MLLLLPTLLPGEPGLEFFAEVLPLGAFEFLPLGACDLPARADSADVGRLPPGEPGLEGLLLPALLGAFEGPLLPLTLGALVEGVKEELALRKPARDPKDVVEPVMEFERERNLD